MSITRSRFGDYVKDERGLSIRWLAARSGISLRKLSMLCNDDETRLWFHESIALSESLSITLEELSRLLPRSRALANRLLSATERELQTKLYG